jgi:hypothetical protein
MHSKTNFDIYINNKCEQKFSLTKDIRKDKFAKRLDCQFIMFGK